MYSYKRTATNAQGLLFSRFLQVDNPQDDKRYLTMKVLIPEKFSQAGIDVLKEAGIDVTFEPDTTPEQLLEIIGQYDGLIVRSATTVTRAVIEAGTNLKIIGRAGVGVDNIDREAATERGIIVCNAPLSNVVSAAEQTMCLMLAAARKTAAASASMKAGNWNRSQFVGCELQDKTLGIFGTGNVGRLVAERAQAFGMKIIGYDPYCSPAMAQHLGITLYDTVDEVCQLADVITVHMPLTDETRNMFSDAQFAQMKDGVIILNVARGGIIDLDALAKYLENGKVAAAGVDVWEHEPVSDSPIHKFENAVLTPHLGASTKEAQTRAATQIAEYVISGLRGKTVATVVNSARIPEAVMEELGPYMPVAQRCAEVASQISKAAITKVEVKAFGEIAKTDTKVLGTAALAGVMTKGSDVDVNIINAEFLAERRGVTVDVQSDPLSEIYSSYVAVTVHSDNHAITIAGTIALGHTMPRIIDFAGYKVDFVPERYVLALEYKDCPGCVAKIGTVLGDANINIETMQIAQNNEREAATLLMNVNKPVTKEQCEQIVKAIDARDVAFIEF